MICFIYQYMDYTYNNWLCVQMKKHFNLQQIQFTQESDDEGNLFSNELIEMYNKDYSLLISETKKFFADDFLNRFITLNNMGIGFNLPFMLTTIINIEDEILSPRRTRNQAEGLKERKQKLEGSFINILKKMGDVIEQMLNFEIKIKTTYLGQAFASPYKSQTPINSIAFKNRNHSTSKKQKSHSNPKKIGDTPQQQNVLRDILKRGMTTLAQKQVDVCNLNLLPEQNLQKLTNKIGNLKIKIEQSKMKQQKIWKIFNQKRPSRNMFQQSAQNLEEQQDKQFKQYKKMNNMLSDIISQKNKFYLSPYQTVQSSFL